MGRLEYRCGAVRESRQVACIMHAAEPAPCKTSLRAKTSILTALVMILLTALLPFTSSAAVQSTPARPLSNATQATILSSRPRCIDGQSLKSNARYTSVKNAVQYLLGRYSTKTQQIAEYQKEARKQCECYRKSSYRLRPPYLPDNNVSLEQVFKTANDMPTFSMDETFFIISAHITLSWQQVVVIIADHVDGNYHVTGSQRQHMRHGSEEVDVYCDFIDHHSTGEQGEKMYGPAQILTHDDHHVRTVSCNIPNTMLQCLRKPAENSEPKCIDVALRTRPKGDHSAEALTVTLLQVCQFHEPQRDDFLVTCTQPMNSRVFHLVAPWIEHHRRLGMERFYLYAEHLGLDRHIEPFLKSNISEIRMWMDPRKKPFWPITFRPLSQVGAMNDCVYRLMDHAKWIAFFDVDEWFHPFKHATLPPFFRPHTDEDVGAIQVFTWYFSHHSRDDGAEMLLSSNYKREKEVTERKRSKNVIRPEKVQIISVHKVMFGKKTQPISEHELRLNHYRDGYDTSSLTVNDDGMHQYESGLILSLQQYYGRTIPTR